MRKRGDKKMARGRRGILGIWGAITILTIERSAFGSDKYGVCNFNRYGIKKLGIKK